MQLIKINFIIATRDSYSFLVHVLQHREYQMDHNACVEPLKCPVYGRFFKKNNNHAECDGMTSSRSRTRHIDKFISFSATNLNSPSLDPSTNSDSVFH